MEQGAVETVSMMDRLRSELERPPFNRWLGVLPIAVDGEDGISISLPYRPEFSHNPSEPVFHGGVVASLIDVAGYAAVAIRCGYSTPTVSLHIDYLAPAAGGDLMARGCVRRLGRSLSRVDVEIFAASRMVAIGRGTFSTKDFGR